MSRIGKQEIQIPKGVTVTQSGNTITVSGPKGKISKIEIDPSQRMADVNRENNTWAPN